MSKSPGTRLKPAAALPCCTTYIEVIEKIHLDDRLAR